MSFIRQIGVSLPYSPAIDLPYSPAIEKSLGCHTQIDCDQDTKNSHVDTAPLEQQKTWFEVKTLSQIAQAKMATDSRYGIVPDELHTV
jgi:hypothetical protein